MASQPLVTMILTGEITHLINIHGNMNGKYVTSHCIPIHGKAVSFMGYQWEIPQYDDGKLCNPETVNDHGLVAIPTGCLGVS